MPLRMAPLGEEVEIRRLAADEKVKRHLEDLGLGDGAFRRRRGGDPQGKRRAHGP